MVGHLESRNMNPQSYFPKGLYKCTYIHQLHVSSPINFCPQSTARQLTMSIHWPCYCTLHVYVVIHFYDTVKPVKTEPLWTEEFVQFRQVFGLYRFKLH